MGYGPEWSGFYLFEPPLFGCGPFAIKDSRDEIFIFSTFVG